MLSFNIYSFKPSLVLAPQSAEQLMNRTDKGNRAKAQQQEARDERQQVCTRHSIQFSAGSDSTINSSVQFGKHSDQNVNPNHNSDNRPDNVKNRVHNSAFGFHNFSPPLHNILYHKKNKKSIHLSKII